MTDKQMIVSTVVKDVFEMVNSKKSTNVTDELTRELQELVMDGIIDNYEATTVQATVLSVLHEIENL